jgi:glycosyltransferase involved in cell wall biosynthesis
MSPDKGAHRAVALAHEAGLPLRIAAKCREPLEREYFERLVRPHLGPTIEYVGEVGHDEKIELLRHARALVFPIEWEEPFGLAMIEAMACGTPVVATRRGSVPEVVEHGRGGIVVDRYTEIPAALELADRLDPSEIRAVVEEQFSPHHMVADYVAAYERAIARAGQDTAASPSRALTSA